ncbi:MAG: 23S rRNA (adenine(2503)-C(2))-methyltransferase RlmN, partial [Spirochaetes bacterium]|nr:23S rRNA (adenine(2503)-C(2))-methyltransferase RlmN [Spirochaetota bacterium]
IKILHGLRCRVNLIHYHNSENSSLKGSPEGIIKQFQDKLNAAGMFTSIRKSRGKDIEAACGMLSIKKDKK